MLWVLCTGEQVLDTGIGKHVPEAVRAEQDGIVRLDFVLPQVDCDAVVFTKLTI